VGTNVIYAAIHQFGGTIRPKSKRALRFRMGGRLFTLSKVSIPARPFLGLTPADRAEIAAIFADFQARALRAGA
jgi:phage gpG-like protein